jgi:SM-20-related protein
MALLDLDALRRAPLTTDPFSYVVVPGFLPRAAAEAVARDFPAIAHPGLLPLEATTPGPAFNAMVEELTAPALAACFAEKFAIDLAGRPTMVTLRGRTQARDGRIHTDSVGKLVTALIYFNDEWENPGGRLRLLRGPDDLDDMADEVAPALGTLVAFRRSQKSFHGHEPHIGVRRSVMINWMSTGIIAQRELMRHRLSAQAKRFLRP